MLSILIPTYNYNVYPMVSMLQQQCANCGISYEIIVMDDGSESPLNELNEKINSLPNCSFKPLEKNIGRSSIRNLLAKTARYDWLLFLDADTMPMNDRLISNYLPYLNDEEKIVYGSIRYQEEKPHTENLLRWVYGNGREVVPAIVRNKNPHIKLLTLNFMIKKQIFEKVSFNESIPNLRHEDTLFSYDLKQAKIKVEHIDNPVYHLGLESSKIFIRKEEQSAEVLKYLVDNNLIDKDYVGISRTHYYIKKYRLNSLIAFAFKIIKPFFTKNLTSNNPSLFIFDLYRLGYLLTLK